MTSFIIVLLTNLWTARFGQTASFVEIMSHHHREAPSRQQPLYREGLGQLYPCLGEKQRAKTHTLSQFLSPLYNGPFDVVSRHDKYFTIDHGGYLDNVTVDRLKAFLEFPTVELDEVL